MQMATSICCTTFSIKMSSNNRKRAYDTIDNDNDERKMPAVERTKISDTVKTPKVGMKLDVRDVDYIWSPARVVKMDNNGDTLEVTVHYQGWNDLYDEHIPWNSERLAPLYSFTKQVKCLVKILLKPKGNPKREELDALPPGARKAFCDLWPCTVQLRMPHPFADAMEDENECLNAECFLREERNVFILPYASHLLPLTVRVFNTHDSGRWINAKRLRPWTSNPLKVGVLSNQFTEAFQVALDDNTTVGVLPSSAVEKGSLLKPALRVHSRAGAKVRDGSLQVVSQLPVRFQEAPPVVVPLGQVQAQHGGAAQMPHGGHNLRTTPSMPPKLPPPIEITDLIYPNCGVKRCQLTNQWTASICIAGNELFLGSFPTQTQAYQATRVAAGDNTVEVESDLQKARLADLRAVPIEAVIEATEKKYDPSVHAFSLKQYVVEQIRYVASQDQENAPGEAKEIASESQPPVATVDSPRKNKRKGRPRKVDLERRCYM